MQMGPPPAEPSEGDHHPRGVRFQTCLALGPLPSSPPLPLGWACLSCAVQVPHPGSQLERSWPQRECT